ncbi:hypothetical protein KFE25_000691 [Diacronema lutheri]|uniref:Cystathionine gamma-synthase n=2 Tax=Diacronema lutheri TaxID=2081491 RepID=A0A8J6CEX1_DIALT|nr:hypothetical protein KFE25_000691 [Diacronema lutheri]
MLARRAFALAGAGKRCASGGVGTVSVKGGEPARASGHMKSSDAIAVPIVQTAAYTFKDSQQLIDFNEGRYPSYEYGRYGNPTVRAVEQKMMELEGAEDCLASTSGMYTAVSMMMALLPEGSRVITTTDCYRRTRQFLNTVINKMGVTNVVIPPGDLDALRCEVQRGAAMFFSESPSNPMLRCVDIPAASQICRAAGTILCIDGTFSTPYNQRPLDLGADIVIHSATKYLAGHHDVLAGVLAGRKDLVEQVRALHGVMGGVLDPHAAYLLLRGLKTLHLRVARQNASAEALARMLHAHPKVKKTIYPSLPHHPDHAYATAQARGFGGVVSFELHGGLHAGAMFTDTLQMPHIAPSLGGCDSLVEQPTIISYWNVPPDERNEIGIQDGLIRFACGVEETDDILADVARALELLDVEKQYLKDTHEAWRIKG